MDKKQNSRIKKGISTIKKQLESVENELIRLFVAADADNDITANESLKELYNCLQEICLFARKFVSNEVSNSTDIEQIFEQELENSEIEIVKFDNDVIKISMPILTPFAIYKRVKLYPNNELTSREIDAISRSDVMINILKSALIKFLNSNKVNRMAYK